MNFPFLPEMKKVDQVRKLVANLRDKKIYIYYTHKKSKTSFKLRILFQKLNQVIISNQNVWLKSYTDMNKELKKQKMILKKISLN